MELTLLNIAVKIMALVLYLCLAYLLQHSEIKAVHHLGRLMAAPFTGNLLCWKKVCPQ